MQAFLTLLDFHGIKVIAWKQTLKWRHLSRSLALRQAPRLFYINVLFIKIDLRGILSIILVFIKWEMWILLFLKNVAI